MPETDYVKRGEVNELRDRLVTVETNQGHTASDLAALRAQMDEGFSKLSQQITATSNKKSMFLTIAGGVGGGMGTALYEILKHTFGL